MFWTTNNAGTTIPELNPFPLACIQIQLITSKGYPAEEHNVTTKDGYILGMQRIPHGKKDSSS